MSVGAIAFVAALSISATGAFFTDNETSTGNTFTAGAIDLKVDSVSHYNRMVCTEVTAGIFQWQPESGFVPGPGHYPATGSTCVGTWTLTDLGPSHKFFDFADIKPGDQGENTVSLHIENNPAWACAYIRTTSNEENTLLEPEVTDGDLGTTTGELAQNLNFFAWLDHSTTSNAVRGDNIWQADEPVLYGPVALSSINATTTLALADPVTNGGDPMAPGVTNYIGLGWCAGALVVSGPGVWSCDGSTMNNQSQTDSATADVTFHVEQSRNNPNFRCVPVQQET